jgi:hypothetical protein
VGELETLYLWFAYASPEGMTLADLSVMINPPNAVNVLAFNPTNGFLNAGSATNLLLGAGDCPTGIVNAGSWLIIPELPVWEFCLGGNRRTLDCQSPPVAWDSDTHGFANGGPFPTCVNGMMVGCIGHSAAESSSWGKVKTLYR